MNFQSVAEFYDAIAESYDEQFAALANYQAPHYLLREFSRLSYSNGIILDVGCGTGKLVDYLEGNFEMTGIDVSPLMARQAERRGYRVSVGCAELILPTLESRSVDHIVALSSLHFVEDINLVIRESHRVARKSIFVTLEQFDNETVMEMCELGVPIYNHQLAYRDACIAHDVHLWTRPKNGKKILGNVLHFVLSTP